LKETTGDLRLRALEVVVRIGPKADQAPVLVALLGERDPGVRVQAMVALRQIGPAAVADLRALLADTATGVEARRAALEVLGRIGPSASAAVPDLVSVLRSDKVFLHHYAALALVRIGPAGVSGLVQVLGDRKAPGW